MLHSHNNGRTDPVVDEWQGRKREMKEGEKIIIRMRRGRKEGERAKGIERSRKKCVKMREEQNL